MPSRPSGFFLTFMYSKADQPSAPLKVQNLHYYLLKHDFLTVKQNLHSRMTYQKRHFNAFFYCVKVE